MSLKVQRFLEVLHLIQGKYVSDLLTCFDLTSYKASKTPMKHGHIVSQKEGVPLSDPFLLSKPCWFFYNIVFSDILT